MKILFVLGISLAIPLTSVMLVAQDTTLTITNDGHVGIGTEGSPARLHVNGVETASSSLFGTFTVSNNEGGKLGLGANQTGIVHTWIQATETSIPRAIALNPQGGEVVIGMTPLVTNSQLQVRGAGSSSATSSLNVQNNSSSSLLFVRDDGNVGIGTINPTANFEVKAGGSTLADGWSVRSSKHLKKNVVTLTNALDKVKNLRGVEYDWKSTGRHDIGLIAEEVGKVIPEVVTFEQNGKQAQSLDYSRLVSLLIEAIKEQQLEIERLKDAVGSRGAMHQTNSTK